MINHMPEAMMSDSNLDLVGHDRRKLRLSLVVAATAQRMLVLDDTIADVALPSIQKAFAVPAALLPWTISAYVLDLRQFAAVRRPGG